MTDHYDQLVEGLVSSGQFKNASEVFRAGLRLLEQQSRETEEKLALLRSLAAEGFRELDQGEGTLINGEQELRQFIGQMGHRAAQQIQKRRADE
ncbi:MAG: type II toxin-antitoxin system ParD family antitoxin [Pirellulales bacterium]|nr:type II toxin-antitoxin system ParD family antitoxin [Pirellulales bacterium]